MIATGVTGFGFRSGPRTMRVNGEPRTSLITFPANGRMPPRVAGAPRTRVVESSEEGPGTARAGQNDNPETRSLGERCIMSFGISSGPVMTPQLYNNTYKFVQTRDTVAIWVEMVHDVRLVRIGAKHRTMRYAGRPASASTAVGQMSKHLAQLKQFLDEAFG